MTMINTVTSDSIRAAEGEFSLHRLKKAGLLNQLVDSMALLTTVIGEEQEHTINTTFLGYDHPIYGGLVDVLLVISELQGPLDFSPQMLAEFRLRNVRTKESVFV